MWGGGVKTEFGIKSQAIVDMPLNQKKKKKRMHVSQNDRKTPKWNIWFKQHSVFQIKTQISFFFFM